MAKILSLVWYKVLPARFGGQKGIAQFNQYLGKLLPLVCVCSDNNEPTGQETYEVVNDLPSNKWQFLDPALPIQLSARIRNEGITHLVLEHCYHGLTGIKLAKKHGLYLIVHSHNMEYARFREMKKWWWRLLLRIERRTHRHAHLSLFKTDADREHAISRFNLDPQKCMVVPFGIDRQRPANPEERMAGRVFLEEKFGIGGHEKIIYFNGTLDYEPNARALQYIVNELIPVLEEKMEVPFRVLATGRIVYPGFEYLKSLKHSRYWYAGQAQTVEPFFMGADLFINPVMTGGGIKVKLMEALSYGLPVVSFRSAAEGVDTALAGKGLALVEDGNTLAFAETMIRALEARQQASDAFFHQYHWSHIAEKVRDRLLELEQVTA